MFARAVNFASVRLAAWANADRDVIEAKIAETRPSPAAGPRGRVVAGHARNLGAVVRPYTGGVQP